MTFSRAVVTGIVALLLFASGTAVGWLVNKAEAPDVPTIALYNGWRLACPPSSQRDKPCTISNDLIDAKSGHSVAQLTIGRDKTGTVLVVTGPYDVLLTAGVGLALGNDKPRVYPYQLCNIAGCVAAIPLDDSLRAAMRQTTQGKLLFASLNHKVVAILFSLDGFDRADRAFEARNGANGWF